MTFSPVCGGSPSTVGCRVPRPQRPLSCGTIGLSGRRGEGHAVAAFCVEGPRRGRRLAQAAATDMGPISAIEFRKSGQPDRLSRLIGRRQHERGRQLMTYSIAAPATPIGRRLVGRRLAAITGTAILAVAF